MADKNKKGGSDIWPSASRQLPPPCPKLDIFLKTNLSWSTYNLSFIYLKSPLSYLNRHSQYTPQEYFKSSKLFWSILQTY